jgi:hypothetical protein
VGKGAPVAARRALSHGPPHTTPIAASPSGTQSLVLHSTTCNADITKRRASLCIQMGTKAVWISTAYLPRTQLSYAACRRRPPTDSGSVAYQDHTASCKLLMKAKITSMPIDRRGVSPVLSIVIGNTEPYLPVECEHKYIDIVVSYAPGGTATT